MLFTPAASRVRCEGCLDLACRHRGGNGGGGLYGRCPGCGARLHLTPDGPVAAEC